MHQTSPPGRGAFETLGVAFVAEALRRSVLGPDDARPAHEGARGRHFGARRRTRAISIESASSRTLAFSVRAHALVIGEARQDRATRLRLRRARVRRGGGCPQTGPPPERGRPNALDRGPGKDTVGAVSLGGDRGRVGVPRVSPAPSHAKLQTRVEDVDATIYFFRSLRHRHAGSTRSDRGARVPWRARARVWIGSTRLRAPSRPAAKSPPALTSLPTHQPTTGLLGDGDVPAVVFRAFRCVVSFSRDPPFVTRETSPTRA